MNEILFFATILLTFVGVIVFYRLFGKVGLFAWIAFASVLANIEVLKCVDIFGLSVTLGNVIYASSFLATDVLSECYGGKESRKAVRVGFLILVSLIILSQCALGFVPNAEDWATPALSQIFGFMPRVCISSVLVYFMSNTLDTYLYDFIAKRTKRVWMRNNLSTMTSQLFDSVLFTFLAFYGTMPMSVLWELSLTTYLIKLLVAVCDTPFIYICKGIYGKRYEGRTLSA